MFRAAMAILKSRGTVYRFGPAAIAICKYADMIFAQWRMTLPEFSS